MNHEARAYYHMEQKAAEAALNELNQSKTHNIGHLISSFIRLSPGPGHTTAALASGLSIFALKEIITKQPKTIDIAIPFIVTLVSAYSTQIIADHIAKRNNIEAFLRSEFHSNPEN